jgi:hypothetical protein
MGFSSLTQALGDSLRYRDVRHLIFESTDSVLVFAQLVVLVKR